MPGELDAAALHLLRTVAEAGSITSAAASLGISQPAVSQQVRRLERRLGTALVERHGRGIRLTEPGRVLARHGASVAAVLASAQAELDTLTGLRAGQVRLVAFPSSSATILPAAIVQLRARHPGVAVTFTEAEPPESLARLRAGTADIAIAFSYPGTDLGRGEDDLSGLVTRHLLDDPVLLALPQAHPLAARPGLHLRDLADQTWIAGCPRCRGHLVHACAAAGFRPEVAFATDDYVAVLGLVAAGLGVALLPELVRSTAQRHPGVLLRAVAGTTARRVSAVTTVDLARVGTVAAMLAALTEAAGEATSG